MPKNPVTKLFTVKEFAKKQGFTEEYVRQMCREQPDHRTGNPLHLPEGWTCQKFGRDWMIYRAIASKK